MTRHQHRGGDLSGSRRRAGPHRNCCGSGTAAVHGAQQFRSEPPFLSVGAARPYAAGQRHPARRPPGVPMAASTLEIEPLDATFGAIVRGVELRSLDDDTWKALYEAWLEYGLLIFPGQFLTKDEQNDFARRFGDLEFAPRRSPTSTRTARCTASRPTTTVKSLRGNEGWHHDSTYMPLQAKGAVFSAEIVPVGGRRHRLGRHAGRLRGARRRDPGPDRRALAPTTRCTTARAAPATCRRSRTTRAATTGTATTTSEPSLRPLVKVHPETGRPNLLIGRHAYGIVGHGPRRVGAVPRPPQRARPAGRPASTTTSGRSATPSSGTTVA